MLRNFCRSKEWKKGLKYIHTSRRVVITGLGVSSSLGSTVESFWDNILQCKSGVSSISTFDTQVFPCKIASEIDSGMYKQIEKWVPKSLISKNIPRFIQFAASAAQQALLDSGWEGDKTMAGVSIGSGIGNVHNIGYDHVLLQNGSDSLQGYRLISPYCIPKLLPNMASGYISIHTGFQGPNHCVSTACATGTHSIGDAASFISRGLANVMLAGASEACIDPVIFAGFCRAKAVSTSKNATPQEASRPFDEDRDGFVMGEGAGILFLEEYESAKARGAKIYAEIIGYYLNGDAHHITQPNTDGAFRCMQKAVEHSQVPLTEIKYINAHATSTMLGDISEINGINALFRENSKNVMVSSTKGSTGHLLGAAGAVEAILTVLALFNQVVPATTNLNRVDKQIDGLVDFVTKSPRNSAFQAAMSNSFGFGGTNATLIFRKIE